MAKKIALEIDIKSSSVGEATKRTTSFTSELRKLREQMASGELKGEAFDEAAARAAKMQDQMDKVNKTVKNLANDNKKLDAFITTAQGIAGGFAAAQGAAALFGDGSEDLQKTMVKLQATMTLLNGVQQVSNLLRKESVLNTVLLGKANVTTAASTKLATLATKSFGKALIATGIGAIVVGIGMLIANFDKVKKAVLDFIPGLSKVADFFIKIKNAVTDFIGVSSEATREIAALEKATKANNVQLQKDIELMEAAGASTRDLYLAKRLLLYQEYELMKAKKESIGLTEEELQAYKDLVHSIAVIDAGERRRLDKERDDARAKDTADKAKESERIAASSEKNRKIREEAKHKEAAALEADAERRLQLMTNVEQREIALLQNKHTKELEAAKLRGEDGKLLAKLQEQEMQELTDNFSKQREDKEIQDDAKRLEISKANELLRIQSIADERERELAALALKHKEDLEAAKLRGEDFLLLEKLQGAESAALKKGFRDEDIADEEATNAALLAAKQAFSNQTISILSSLSNLAKDNSRTQKALALGAIAVDTGTAISAAVANSAKNPLNAATGGIAGAVQFATSLAQIAAGAAQAKRVLQGGQVRGAGASVGNARTTTELQPPTQINRDIQLQDRGGSQQRVFVLENDITQTQDRITRIRQNSTID